MRILPKVSVVQAHSDISRNRGYLTSTDENARVTAFLSDATHLDLWVLSELRDLFARASQNATLNAELRRPGLVFFLHLLGCDTTGHTYRPFSPEYIGNAIVVDAISREVDALFRAFYNEDEFDSRTAFVMTADHGMSTKGNHGDGDPDNTRTPLLAWGPGVRGPRALDPDSVQAKARREEMQKDAYFREWDLENVWRSDVEQADIAPLMVSCLRVLQFWRVSGHTVLIVPFARTGHTHWCTDACKLRRQVAYRLPRPKP